MSDIRELIEKWRKIAYLSHGKIQTECFDQCADQLEAAMPAGTIITEDESTWPEEGQKILYRLRTGMSWGYLESWEWHSENDAMGGCIWYPIPKGMFEPPEQS